MNHDFYLTQTFGLALKSVSDGNHPFGAILVKNDRVIAKALNTVNTDGDVTRHAELNLVSWASRHLFPEDLKESTLYTSTEPCAMCTGAIAWSGIKKIVYSCPAEDLARIAGGGYTKCRDTFHQYCPDGIVIGPLLGLQGQRLHQNYWTKRF